MEKTALELGLGQIPTGDESIGLVKLKKHIQDGKPTLMNGDVIHGSELF